MGRLPFGQRKGGQIGRQTGAECTEATSALQREVAEVAQLMGEAREMMKTILGNGPLAVALCIEAIDRGLEMSLDEGLILEANHFGLLAATEDMREGMRAFLEKRTPAFKGK